MIHSKQFHNLALTVLTNIFVQMRFFFFQVMVRISWAKYQMEKKKRKLKQRSLQDMLPNSPTNTLSKVPQSINQGPSSTSPSIETSSVETSDELRREIPQEFLNTAEINQPVNFKFPYRLFGKQRRSLQAPWFKQYKWLREYRFCFVLYLYDQSHVNGLRKSLQCFFHQRVLKLEKFSGKLCYSRWF